MSNREAAPQGAAAGLGRVSKLLRGASDAPAEAVPLTRQEMRQWTLEQMSPGGLGQRVIFRIELRGPLELGALEQAINDEIRRHEILRTGFVANEQGQAMRVVAPQASVKLAVTDLTSIPEAERRTVLETEFAKTVAPAFDMAKPPLVRFPIWKLGDREHLFVMDYHHIIADGVSANIFIYGVVANYESLTTRGTLAEFPPSPGYSTYARRHHEKWTEARLQEERAAWKRELDGAPMFIDLPTDRPRPTNGAATRALVRADVPTNVRNAVYEFCKREQLSPAAFFKAAIAATIWRWSGVDDMIVATPLWRREHKEDFKIQGCVADPAVLRMQVDGEQSFRSLLQSVDASLTMAIKNDLAFGEIMNAVNPPRDALRQPLAQVMIFNMPGYAQLLNGLDAGPLSFRFLTDWITGFDFWINSIDLGDVHRLEFFFPAEIFDESTVAAIVKGFLNCVEAGVHDPDTTVAKLMRAVEPGRFTVAIAATFTADLIRPQIEFLANEIRLPVRVDLAPFNQVFQQLLARDGLFRRNDVGANVVMLRFSDLLKTGDPEAVLGDFVGALKNAAAQAAAPFVVVVCPEPPATTEGAPAIDTALLTERLRASLEKIPLISPADIASAYPVTHYYDAVGDTEGYVPYTQEYFAALGTMVVRKLVALVSAPFKVIVADCDNTLWKGVCGEDGPLGIEISHPYRAVQELLVAQQAAGKLICLCSKNSEHDVDAVFQARGDMPLKSDHVIARRVNWQPKSMNIKSLADELNLGLDSFIFIDDNPVECAEVKAQYPQVLVLHLPPPDEIPRFLKHVWAFDAVTMTEADAKRTEMYRQERARDKFRKTAMSFGDFIKNLQLEVVIKDVVEKDFARASQMTFRTTQFNATSKKYQEPQLKERIDGGARAISCHVKDRFGDYGFVGLALVEPRADELMVDTILLSCRALGKGVEHRMLAHLGQVATEAGLKTVTIPFTKSPRNQPIKDFLNKIVGQYEKKNAPGGEEGSTFVIPAQMAKDITFVATEDNEVVIKD